MSVTLFFAAIGFFVYVVACFQIGYVIGLACDAKASIDELLKPTDTHIAELVALIDFVDASKGRKA